MRYISLFSGVEAATVAWHDLGWDPVVFAEFDDFPSMVLKHHYPNVKNVGDVMKHEWKQYKGKADLIVGGSPCQSFSVAGTRLGMDDPRGNLALHYLRIVREVQPKWFVFENVPGLLSSNGGEDFAIFLGEVAKCGYGFAYRILDAQHFGVPQRRRRVFVVGCADGDWRSAAAVLFERESLSGNTEKSEEAWQDSPLFTQTGVSETKRNDNSRRRVGFVIDSVNSNAMKSGNPNSGCRETDVAPTLDTFPPSPAKNQGGLAIIDKGIIHCENVGPTIGASGPPYSRTGNERVEHEALVVQKTTIPIHAKTVSHSGGGDRGKTGKNPDNGVQNGFGVGKETDPMNTLDTSCNHAVFQSSAGLVSKGNGEAWEIPERHMALTSGGGQAGQGYAAVRQNAVVRRMTPLECERLQGFPDNYTQIAWKGKPAHQCPDTPRYKAMGNSMAVPVMKWIGMGIDAVDSIRNTVEREKSKTTEQKKLW